MSALLQVADLEFGGCSQTGNVRPHNEDALLLPDRTLQNGLAWLAGLADGMGGYACGEIASALALATLRETLLQDKQLPTEKSLRQAMEAANLGVYKAARQMDVGRMGTTLTAACLVNGFLYLAHIGDSRAYLLREGKSTCLTNDHTLVGEMVRSRLLPASAIRGHDQRSVLTRALGLELFPAPEITRISLRPRDEVILCSDGVWEVIEDEEFATFASQSPQPAGLANLLVQTALQRQSEDNCSALALKIRGFHSVQMPTPKRFLGFPF